MTYFTGECIKNEDNITLEHSQKTTGIVFRVIDSVHLMNEWDVKEFGIMIKSKPFGLVFWPESEIQDQIVFLSRKGD